MNESFRASRYSRVCFALDRSRSEETFLKRLPLGRPLLSRQYGLESYHSYLLNPRIPLYQWGPGSNKSTGLWNHGLSPFQSALSHPKKEIRSRQWAWWKWSAKQSIRTKARLHIWREVRQGKRRYQTWCTRVPPARMNAPLRQQDSITRSRKDNPINLNVRNEKETEQKRPVSCNKAR